MDCGGMPVKYCLSICAFVCLFGCLPVCLFDRPFVSVCLSVWTFIVCRSVCLYVHFVCLSVRPSIPLPTWWWCGGRKLIFVCCESKGFTSWTLVIHTLKIRNKTTNYFCIDRWIDGEREREKDKEKWRERKKEKIKIKKERKRSRERERDIDRGRERERERERDDAK